MPLGTRIKGPMVFEFLDEKPVLGYMTYYVV
jgi:hypothetical protein